MEKVEPLDEIMPIAMPEAFEEALELLFEEKIYTPNHLLMNIRIFPVNI